MKKNASKRIGATSAFPKGWRCWLLLVGLAWLLGSATVGAVTATLSVPGVDYDGTFSASWNVDPGPNQGGYTQLQQRVNGGSWTTLVQKGLGSQSHTVAVSAGGTYEFAVHYAYMPQDPCGQSYCTPSLIHGDTAIKATVVTLTAPANAPTLSLPGTDYDGSYTVSWNTVGGTATYQLQQRIGTGSWVTAQNTSATSKAYSGQPVNTYSYRVRSCNPNGCSSYSSVKTIAVESLPIPDVPTGLNTIRKSDGRFKTTWNPAGNLHPDLGYYRLQRRNLDVTNWAIVNGSGKSTALDNQSLALGGIFEYRVQACNGSSKCSGWSPVDYFKNPLGFHPWGSVHKVLSGDFNGDGRKDLYIKQTDEFANVEPFYLRQKADKSFEIIGNLSSTSLATLEAWPATNIEVVTIDANLDGTLDLHLKGVGSVASGADDQMVFGPDSAFAPPIGVTAFDADMRQFFAEVGRALADPAYFDRYADIAVVPIEVVKTGLLYVPEYCGIASEEEMAAAPPVPIRFSSSEPNNVEETAVLTSNCLSRWGPGVIIHYDFVTYQWSEIIPAGVKDYSKFNPYAMEIIDILRAVWEEWILEDGSAEKILIEAVLEKVFPVPVFTGNLDDEREFEDLRVLFNYYADETRGFEGATAGDCPATAQGLDYFHALNRHGGSSFSVNSALAGRISKTSQPIDPQNPQSKTFWTVTLNVSFRGPAADEAVIGAKSWNTTCKLNNNDRVKLQVNADVDQDEGIITAKSQRGQCRDEAKKGGTEMTVCVFDSKGKRSVAGKHEFGHILGFDNVYRDELPDDPAEPGFEEDIMADSRGGRIFGYHLNILIMNY